MKTKTIVLYTFDELSSQAKEKAREWWLGCVDENDYDATIEDAVHMGELLGIEIEARPWTNTSGFNGSSPKVYWSGFCCQGDGACFEGAYRYKKGAVKAVKTETSAGRDDASKGDRELLRIAQGLQEIQRKNFYQLAASTRQDGYYMHSQCMSVDVSRDDKEMTQDAEEVVTQLLRDFADWIYSQLELENEYIYSDENVDEAIRANEYTFTVDGKREA